MIAESHIATHTFPNKGFVTIDVYPGQGNLDVATCNAYFKKIFSVNSWEQNMVKRGQRYGSV